MLPGEHDLVLFLGDRELVFLLGDLDLNGDFDRDLLGDKESLLLLDPEWLGCLFLGEGFGELDLSEAPKSGGLEGDL